MGIFSISTTRDDAVDIVVFIRRGRGKKNTNRRVERTCEEEVPFLTFESKKEKKRETTTTTTRNYNKKLRRLNIFSSSTIAE